MHIIAELETIFVVQEFECFVDAVGSKGEQDVRRAGIAVDGKIAFDETGTSDDECARSNERSSRFHLSGCGEAESIDDESARHRVAGDVYETRVRIRLCQVARTCGTPCQIPIGNAEHLSIRTHAQCIQPSSRIANEQIARGVTAKSRPAAGRSKHASHSGIDVQDATRRVRFMVVRFDSSVTVRIGSAAAESSSFIAARFRRTAAIAVVIRGRAAAQDRRLRNILPYGDTVLVHQHLSVPSGTEDVDDALGGRRQW